MTQPHIRLGTEENLLNLMKRLLRRRRRGSESESETEGKGRGREKEKKGKS